MDKDALWQLWQERVKAPVLSLDLVIGVNNYYKRTKLIPIPAAHGKDSAPAFPYLPQLVGNMKIPLYRKVIYCSWWLAWNGDIYKQNAANLFSQLANGEVQSVPKCAPLV
jgi:hypothetical protein